MTERRKKHTVLITEPGILALGARLRAWPSVQYYLQHETIVQVACGRKHSAVVCDSGRVYTFDWERDNGWMEVTTGTITEPRVVATLAPLRVTQAACGYQHTMILTDQGELYSCGLNYSGQLGLGHTDSSPTPVLVTGLPPIKKVATGGYHTEALAESGEVWVTGYNGYGQLGLGHTTDQTSFILVPNLAEPIIDISCGWDHTALVSASRVLLVTGKSAHGVLGLGASGDISSFKPVCVSSSAVAAVSCGFDHTVTLRADGTVWSCGSNSCGQLGTGDRTDRSTPTEMIVLENHTITEVVAGYYHTALLTEKGDVLVCGKGSSGVLGKGKEDLLVATLLFKSPGLVVKQAAFAENYSLMLVVSETNISATPQLPCGATIQDVPARGCVTDMERIILSSLECPVCLKVMSSPIHQCLNGHSLCNACKSNPNVRNCPLCKGAFQTIRNITLEHLSEEVQLPCVECLHRMPACELEQHAEVCPSRQYGCPVQQSCGWSGRPDTMLAHTTSKHPDQTWRDLPHSFSHSTSDELLHTDVLVAFKHVFTLHRKYCNTTGEFRASVRYIDVPEHMDKFKVEFTILTGDEERLFRRNICPQLECVEVSLQSSNCVLLKRDTLDTFLQQGSLLCRVAIITV